MTKQCRANFFCCCAMNKQRVAQSAQVYGYDKRRDIKISPDGRYVATVADSDVRLYHITIDRCLAMHNNIFYIDMFAFANDSKSIVIASSQDCCVRVLCITDKERLKETASFNYQTCKLQVRKMPTLVRLQDQYLVLQTDNNMVSVWENYNSPTPQVHYKETSPLYNDNFVISPDCKHVVYVRMKHSKQELIMADFPTMDNISLLCGSTCVAVDITPDSTFAIAACTDGTYDYIRVYNIQTRMHIKTFVQNHNILYFDTLTSIKISTYGSTVLHHHCTPSILRTATLVSSTSTMQIQQCNKVLVLLLGESAKYQHCKYQFHGKFVSAITKSEFPTVCTWYLGEWSDRYHVFFHLDFRKIVFQLMCCKQRMEAETGQCTLPRLPMAVWLQIFAILLLKLEN